MFYKQLRLLEAQKQQEWDTYAVALTQSIETAARSIQGLRVPIEVAITTNTDSIVTAHQKLEPLAEQLLDAAVTATPSPADLPGTPLERIAAKAQ
ncbi:hypothetical protein [Plantibacter sp. M259]|uniref:hypothetical protein n=1 Tax=Plantibacter sp. M259 TaxID=2583822 RepID=UPI0011100F19|nr:hypothetical protein [Plantibacter sp. M259]